MTDLPDVHPALAVTEGEERPAPRAKFRERQRACLVSCWRAQTRAGAR
jgi:hypothetical protein